MTIDQVVGEHSSKDLQDHLHVQLSDISDDCVKAILDQLTLVASHRNSRL